MIPNGTNILEEEAFEGIAAEMIVLPESIQQICSRAFANSKAEVVIIPDEFDRIASDAFEGCMNLRFVCSDDSPAAVWAIEHGLQIYPSSGE